MFGLKNCDKKMWVTNDSQSTFHNIVTEKSETNLLLLVLIIMSRELP